MEGAIAFYEVQKLLNRIKELETENALLKKKLVETTPVSFGSAFMDDPLPEEPETPRPVWRPYPNANWREDGIF